MNVSLLKKKCADYLIPDTALVSPNCCVMAENMWALFPEDPIGITPVSVVISYITRVLLLKSMELHRR